MNGKTTLGSVAVALCLSGCAGGGSSPATSTVQPTTTPPRTNPTPPVSGADAFRTAEYQRMGTLDQVHAADAYALGYTGRGVTVGVIDFNFDFSSSEVSYHAASLGPSADAQALYEAQTGEPVSTDIHGLAVASVIAAQKNDVGGHGIAFDAQVLGVDYFSGVNERQTVQDGVVVHISDPWTYITSHGARIINTSFGYEASDVINSPPSVSDVYVIDTAAVGVGNGALVVSAAGNASGANPSLYDLDTIDDLRTAGTLDSGPGAYIIVGAVDASNQIASFSDRAGVAANYYMVAPGVDFVLPWNGGTAILSGTSFSAPMVSGAAAIVLQRWPDLTARQVAQILFDSATDLGTPGVDTVYGHGLLNIAAALQPLGVSTLAVSGGVAPAVSATSLVLGPAFGDAPAFHQALSQVMIFDGFGRDFEADLSRTVGSRPNLPDVFGAMEQRLGWHSAAFQVGSNTALSYDVRRKPEDGIAPFQTLAGPDDRFTRETVFRLSGVAEGVAWAAGTGLSLRDGMGGENRFASVSLTNPFSPMVGAAPGAFASARVELGRDVGLTFGAAHADNQGLTDHLRTPFRNSAETAALRLDGEMASSRLSLEFGSSLETGGMMGSLAAGGLTMASRASTTWTTAAAETALDAHWSLKGAFTLAATAETHPQASLITAIGPVYATSFALGAIGESLFQKDDALSFTFSQPLRAERANVTLMTGVARDWTTGGVIMGEMQSSLVPSGREFDIETGYRFSVAGFGAAANVAYALDPDHVRGGSAVLALFILSRTF